MKTKHFSNLPFGVAVLALLLLSCPDLAAERFGLFTYQIINGTVRITDYPEDAVGEVVIPAEIDGKPVTSISPSWIGDNSLNAFRDCREITSITIPDSVTHIGGGAFFGCHSLTSITIPRSVTTLGIGAFADCSSLEAILVEDGNSAYTDHDGVLYDIGGTTLQRYPGAKAGAYRIPDGVASIDSYVFYGCHLLTSLAVPPSVLNISGQAFRGASELREILVDEANPAYADLDGVLYNDELTTLLSVPEGKAGTHIIPEGATIQSWAFYGCHRLASVVLPDSLTRIDDYAFHGFSGLTTISIPQNVTSIGNWAFVGCANLNRLAIHEGITNIDGFTFDGCASLVSFDVDPGNQSYSSRDGVLFDSTGTVLLRYPEGKMGAYVVPPGVVELRAALGDYLLIDQGAFENCRGLTSIEIPNTVTEIGSNLFSGCTSLASITLPESISEIELTGPGTPPEAFPPVVSRSDTRSFAGCTGLRALHVAAGNPNYTSIDGLLYDSAGTKLLLCPEGREGDLTLPAGTLEISGWFINNQCCGLTKPSSRTGAFWNCAKLTGITIPGTVMRIGDGAFSGCRRLHQIRVETGSIDYSSRDGVLFDAAGETLLRYPEGRTGAYAVPSSVFRITGRNDDGGGHGGREGESAFAGCDGLTSITFPEEFVEVEGVWHYDELFKECSSLKSAILLGDNPGRDWAYRAFPAGLPQLTIYYLEGSAGYSSPALRDIPVVMISEATAPTSLWLLENSFRHDTSLDEDLDGDGVSLLMAYALKLDPNSNLRSALPAPTINGSQLRLTFFGARPDLTYTVETSTDLENWTSSGVTLSEPNLEGIINASVERDLPKRFLRLVVSN